MEQCKRTENTIEFCTEMYNETESNGLFENVYLEGGRRLILMNGTTFIDFCPFCGGKLAEG